MESSDDNFAWTSTSNASEDSHDSDTMIAEEVNGVHSDDQSDSGEVSKAKLQKQLFKELPNCTVASVSPPPRIKLEPDSDGGVTTSKKKSKRKSEKQVHEESTEEETFLNQKVKVELTSHNSPSPRKSHKRKRKTDSDTDLSSRDITDMTKPNRKKRKKRHSELMESNFNVSHTNSQSSELCDESYLKLRVKEEMSTAATSIPSESRKRKHKGDSTMELNLLLQSPDISSHKKKKRKRTHSDIEEPKIESSETENQLIKKKNSKRKSYEFVDSDDTKDIEDKFSAAETEVETREENHSSGNKKFKTKDSESISHRLTEDKVSKLESQYSSKEFISDESGTDENTEGDKTLFDKNNRPSIGDHINSRSNNETYNQTHKAEISNSDSSFNDPKLQNAKISDRIRFEDEVDLNLDSDNIQSESSQFRHILRQRPHLLAVQYSQDSDFMITPESDNWILKCPHDVDIMDFKKRDLTLDSRSKIKINGKTYDGNLMEEESRLNILSVVSNGTIIKNIPLCGMIRFRRKIPKAHFMEDNIIVNDRCNFIPLPDTKRRHPIFGSDYKRAMKVPKRVRARLRAAPAPRLGQREPEPEPEPESETPPPPPPRKHKKKHKKDRSTKHEAATDDWDSAQAIEQNLFNF